MKLLQVSHLKPIPLTKVMYTAICVHVDEASDDKSEESENKQTN